jgi:hypothetical protein
MSLLWKVVSNRKCGLCLREAVKAAMLDREIGRITRRLK